MENSVMKLGLYSKRNSLVVGLYSSLLRYQCRTVKGYIFVATTGRSGSGSLTKIFGAVNNATCFHEPYPIMFNDCPSNADRQKYFRDLFYKVKRINVLRSAKGHSYYVETNHQFIKNFAQFAIESFSDRIRIVHLVRDPVKVGASLFSIGSIPAKTKRGKYHLIDPNDDNNLINIPDLLGPKGELNDDLYKCLWYWYEIQMRIKEMKRKSPHIRWAKIRTDDLNQKEALIKMFQQLDVPVNTSKLDNLVGTHINTRQKEKRKNVDLKDCENRNQRLVAILEQRYGKKFWC